MQLGGEVARRLAHEIKNPLTPIQLSAERIRRKYLDTLADEDRETLDRSTTNHCSASRNHEDNGLMRSQTTRAPHR